MNEGSVKIILAIIGLLGTIITYVLVPYIKSKTTENQRENLYIIVRTAVMAAEQMHQAGLINIPKKEFVIDYLNSLKVKITIEDLDILIEAAVKELELLTNY